MLGRQSKTVSRKTPKAQELSLSATITDAVYTDAQKLRVTKSLTILEEK